jgi:hypothetical protein
MNRTRGVTLMDFIEHLLHGRKFRIKFIHFHEIYFLWLEPVILYGQPFLTTWNYLLRLIWVSGNSGVLPKRFEPKLHLTDYLDVGRYTKFHHNQSCNFWDETFVIYLFNDAAWNSRLYNDEWRMPVNLKDVEGISFRLIEDNILAFAWRDWGKQGGT